MITIYIYHENIKVVHSLSPLLDSTYMYDSRVSETNRVYMEMYEVYNELIKDLGAVPGVQSEFLDIEETPERGARVKVLALV